MARYRLQEWLNFITSEIHKGFSPLFNPAMPDEAKVLSKAKLADRFKWLDGKLAGQQYLMGDTFSVADAYLFTTANWSKHVGLDISGLANLGAYLARVAARPAVQAAMRAEGLIK
jgi:glutathione S-transferase